MLTQHSTGEDLLWLAMVVFWTVLGLIAGEWAGERWVGAALCAQRGQVLHAIAVDTRAEDVAHSLTLTCAAQGEQEGVR